MPSARAFALSILLLLIAVALGPAAIGGPGAAAVGSTPTFLSIIGGPGVGLGQFNGPQGVAVNAAGEVYISDTGNNRVQKYSGGVFSLVGGPGSGLGSFNQPGGIAIDASGNIYFADTGNNRVQMLSAVGSVFSTFAGPGVALGLVNAPQGVAVGPSGDVYIADTGNNRVQKYSGGAFSLVGGPGTGLGSFNSPRGVAVDGGGNVYFADTGNNRVQKLTAVGSVFSTFAGAGTSLGTVNAPEGVAADAAGNVHIADTGNNRVEGFIGGAFSLLGGPGTAAGSFNQPAGIATDSSGQVFIADTLNNRIQVFSSPADGTAPSVVCTPPSAAVWYGADVSVPCTASDTGSGLANPGDASFNLTTSVALGSETAAAATNSRPVCDVATNCAPAGPYVFQVDKKAPVITLTTPPNGAVYVLGQNVTAAFGCTDSGSGVATCSGTAANGSAVDTSTLGPKSFTVNSTDNAGNPSGPVTSSFTVGQPTTTTTVTGHTASVAGQPSTLTATVTVTPPGGGAPTGSVTMGEGANSCSAPLAAVLGVQTASCAVTFATAGVHWVSAAYPGDANYLASNSAAAAHTVNKAGTVTALTTHAPEPSLPGQGVLVSLTLSVASPGSGTPTGAVTVSDGATTCTATLPALSCTLTIATAGAKTLTATYNGDTNFNAGASTGVPHTVITTQQAATALKTAVAAGADPLLAMKLGTYLTSASSYLGFGSPTMKAAACHQLNLFKSAVTSARGLDPAIGYALKAQADAIRASIPCISPN